MAVKTATLPPALEDGTGWTAAHVVRLRELLGGEKPLARQVFADAVGASERTIYRWEHGLARITTMPGRTLARYAYSQLPDDQLAELARIAPA